MKILLAFTACLCVSLTACQQEIANFSNALNQSVNLANAGGTSCASAKDENGNSIPQEDCKYWVFYNKIPLGMGSTSYLELRYRSGIQPTKHMSGFDEFERPSGGVIRIYREGRSGDMVVYAKKWTD